MGSTRFVGRAPELAALRDAAARARAGEPRFVVIGGEPGVGKTRLIDQFAAELGPDVRVLHGAGVELGTEGLALAPVTAILRELVATDGAALTALPGADALLHLLPEQASQPSDPPNQARLFDLFRALVQHLSAERPVLLVVDDLHWADRSTRELLDVLVRTLRSARVMVIAAHRSDLPRGHPLRPFLAELARLPSVRELTLAPFSRAEITELLTDVVGPLPEATIEQVHHRSGGNAYFAEELARADGDGTAGLPNSLSAVLLHRIDRLPDAARNIVRLAAVGGRVVPHELLAATAGMGESELLDALRSAAHAGVLVPGPAGYAFRSALLHEAIVEDLLPAERISLHRAFARALEAEPTLVGPEQHAAQTAFHWYGAGEDRQALPALMRAADTAGRLNAHAEQAQLLGRVLELWPRVPDAAQTAGADRMSLFESAIGAATWAGEDLHALDLIDRALTDADAAREPERTAMLLAQRGMTLANLDRDSAVTVVDEALRLLPPDRSVMRARVLDLASAVLAVRGQPEQARVCAQEAADLAAELGESWTQTNARTTHGWALVQLGRYDEGIATLNAARVAAVARRDSVGAVRAQLNLAEAARHLGQFEVLIDTARAGLEEAEAAGLRRTLGALLAVKLTAGLVATGRWDEADRTAAAAISVDPPAAFGAALHAPRVEIFLARGELDAARAELSLAHTLSRDTAGPPSPVTLRHDIELALHDTTADELRAPVLAAITEIGSGSSPHDAWPFLISAARLAAQSGPHSLSRTDGVDPLVAALPAAAARLPHDTPLWSGYAAELAAETGVAGASWPDVVTAWDVIGKPYAAAHARLRAAEAALAAGDPDVAGPLLRAAGDEARRLGATPLLDNVTMLARSARIPLDDATGETTTRDRVGLTEREIDVLRLVMLGRSNRQIGEQLFISPKTVSVHVSNILAKLGVSSRGEAVATAHRLHLLDTTTNDHRT